MDGFNMKLILRELAEQDEKAFLRGYEDWKNDELTWYSFVWKPGMSHAEHLQKLQDQKDKNKIPSNFVPSTMLYAFVDEEIVGRVSIRHELNQFLFERGGHIGYAVNPSYRDNGYGTEMMKQALSVCESMNLHKILITCSKKNLQSCKIIARFGGIMENEFFDSEKNEFVLRYWIDLYR
jgi:predicted acetyltransferase